MFGDNWQRLFYMWAAFPVTNLVQEMHILSFYFKNVNETSKQSFTYDL